MSEAVVVGGGLVGLAAAWALAERGLDVELIDAGGPGASDRAQGQVVPPRFAPRALWSDSLRFYDRLAGLGEFEWDGIAVGSLELAGTAAELAELAEQGRGQVLDAQGVAEREPGLAPTAGGLLVDEGRRLRPDLVVATLNRVVRHAGVRVRAGLRATALERTAGGRWRVSTSDGGRTAAVSVVLAAGLGTEELVAPLGMSLPLAGVRGHVLLTEPLPPTLRGLVAGPRLGPATDPRATAVALMAHQRRDGRVVVGASWTRDGAAVPADLDHRVLRGAAAWIPALGGAGIDAAWWGVRPGTPDGLPVVDELAPGLFACCGHGGEGFICGPGSARLVAGMVMADLVGPHALRADRFPSTERRGATA
ncbi:NAD(P)/FAD-dependent oxidoreductase [Actinokineospora sp. 24-640]